MAQTVVGMFDDVADAQKAVERLSDKGFSRDMIDVNNNGDRYPETSDERDDDDGESGISKFFRSLFSSDDDHHDREKYVHVARRSKSIVTVHAQTADQAEEAADILDDCGAVDVDEKAASYGAGGRSGNDTTNDDTRESAVNTGTSERSDYNSSNDTARDTSIGSGIAGRTDYNTSNDNTRDSLSSSDTTRRTKYDTNDATRNQDSTRDADDNDRFRDNRNDRNDETTKIPVIEENLEVGKKEVLTGGRRLRSRIIEKPVEEVLRLREENVHVERTPVDRAATSDDLDNFKESEIELTEKKEVPVVSKEARVVEEVRLDKEVTERKETVSDTVRKTEVDVENLDKDTDRSDDDYRNTTDSNDRR